MVSEYQEGAPDDGDEEMGLSVRQEEDSISVAFLVPATKCPTSHLGRKW